jgi:EmrB/QacA subfamily drug resistance transporter
MRKLAWQVWRCSSVGRLNPPFRIALEEITSDVEDASVMTEVPLDRLSGDLPPYDLPGAQGEPPLSPKEPPRQLVFAIVAIALFMCSVDLTIVATALPAIHRGLRASINWVGWTITIYGLAMVVALPIAGKFCIQFGRRRVFLFGIVTFTAASLLCGFATDIYVLIFFRAVQAIGAGALQPSAAGLIADHFGKDRDRGIGMFGAVSSAGQVVGPIFGGLIVGYLSWRWIFFVNVPIGVVLVLLTVRYIPESRGQAAEKTDVVGLLLMAFMVLTAIFGITSLGDGRTQVYDPIFLAPELCAVVLLVLFVRHTRSAAAPFIPVRLLVGKGFAVMNWVNLLHGVVTFGIAALVPLYAEQRYHLAALSAGTLLTARAIGMIAVGTVAAFTLRRTGYRMPMMLGFSTVALGTLLMSVSPRWGVSPYVWLSVSVGIAGLGLGAVNPAASNACLQIAPDQAAAITGLRVMFINLGVIFSVSVTTAILNRSSTPGITQAHVFWAAAAVVFLVMVPLCRRVPEHKGGW